MTTPAKQLKRMVPQAALRGWPPCCWRSFGVLLFLGRYGVSLTLGQFLGLMAGDCSGC